MSYETDPLGEMDLRLMEICELKSELAALREENKRLREALERIRDGEWGNDHPRQIAREALKGPTQ